MSLPIPDILQNAGVVIDEAKKTIRLFGDKPEFSDLKDAVKRVSSDDLLSVLNEIGKVYSGIHNIQVLQMSADANKKTGNLDLILQVEFGLGLRAVVVPMPKKVAEEFLKNFTEELTGVKSSNIIKDLGSM